MNRLPYLLIFVAMAVAPAVAQQNRYSATTNDVSLSASATTLTIQKAAAITGASGKPITLESFTIYCSVACSVTQAYNGAAATATAATATPIPPNTQTPATATAWSASNVGGGGGTAVGGITHVPAGGTVTIPVPLVVLNGNGSAANYSATVASITGTANLTVIWSEPQ